MSLFASQTALAEGVSDLVASLLSVAVGALLALGASFATTRHSRRLSLRDEARRSERAALIEMGKSVRVPIERFNSRRTHDRRGIRINQPPSWWRGWWPPFYDAYRDYRTQWGTKWTYDVQSNSVREADRNLGDLLFDLDSDVIDFLSEVSDEEVVEGEGMEEATALYNRLYDIERALFRLHEAVVGEANSLSRDSTAGLGSRLRRMLRRPSP